MTQLNDGYCGAILEEIEEVLMEEGDVSLIGADLIEEYPRLLQDVPSKGFILILTLQISLCRH